ncbi:hypothetical protein KEM52_002526 [Ascosphaera acerosa]|nr:hypothetical protein KEM52_002526 [Ascosphaera acerosa]
MMQTAATVVLCPPAPPTTSLDDIIRALEIIHERTSTNDARRQASEFLECQKQGGFAAAQNGYQLAINKTNTPIVRHFGLSLLHHLLKHGSMTLSVDEVDAVRELVCRLAACLTSDDLAYIRNKVAVLWAEVAKRTWALSWWTMDQELVELWEKSLLHKEFVLVVLETLSEDIIHHEDTISSLRGTDLNRKLVEIVMPQEAFDKSLVVKAPGDKEKVRFGSEGWLTRVSMLLQYCVQNAGTGHPEVLLCLQGSLTTLTSFLAWATAASIEVSQTVPNIFAALALENDEIILAAMDALHAMYGRTGCTMSKAVLGSIFAKDRLDFLMRLYSWSMVGPDQAGELKYTISKKVSELAAYLCSYLEYREYVLEGAEVEAFFSLLHAIVNHPSLVISIPILHSFSKLLACGMLKHDDNLYPTIVSVVQLCTTRIVRYEVLPDDSDDPSVQFLNEDIDTEPEKSAFTHNYRKYAALVIEGVVNARPDAMMHLLSQVTERLQALYDGLPPFQASEFHKYTRAQIRADTQFCVAEAVLRGFRKWEDAQPPESTDRTNLESLLESWGCQLMGCHFEDPYIRQRAMKVAVDTSTRVLYNRPVFGLRVLQYVMASFMRVDHDYRPYVEAVDELHHLAVYEVRRLAFRYSDHFAVSDIDCQQRRCDCACILTHAKQEYFDTLENQVREVQAITAEPNKPGIDLSPMLLIIL